LLWLFLLLFPPVVFTVHTLFALAFFIPVYGSRSMRWSGRAIEIVAKQNSGRTRIWGRPGAQTHGLVIFYAGTPHQDSEPLRVHERVHILQELLFGWLYLITYVGHFGINLILSYFLWQNETEARWKRAYRRIIWERWAYRKQARFEAGEIPGAWGSLDDDEIPTPEQ
jgi:hypothetical protein